MAFHKTLAHRFLHMAKSCTSHFRPAITRKLLPESDNTVTRRFLHKDPIPPDRFPFPQADNLIERIRMLNGSRIRFDCLIPPKIQKEEEEENRGSNISVEEVRKVLKAARLEMARSRLRSMEKERISYAEFLKVCGGISNLDEGLGIAKALDESGVVIVLGDVVFLRPDQTWLMEHKEALKRDRCREQLNINSIRAILPVAKAVEHIIHPSMPQQNSCHKNELRELEEKKVLIDKLAEDGVKRELWCGLGFMVVQTIGLMRLTFWELSWDVMEPICFYLTSMYFLAGYGFFLRTSKEPSFESFFQSRFDAKQKRLMKAYNFDLSRFKELKNGCASSIASLHLVGSPSSACDCCRRGMEIGIVH